ncbi:hypothetical protein [Bradyrhizobium mercantei]|uniref:hypothetical protein n=1 Tax=Bradyrhizobium mercantei TaxID=1904807 RepID=UPI0013563F8B|nr:hypothetical protein [Bradyrhizobium mercantei]
MNARVKFNRLISLLIDSMVREPNNARVGTPENVKRGIIYLQGSWEPAEAGRGFRGLE